MDLKIDRPLILASASPSRKMLLERAEVPFEVVVSGVDEEIAEELTPAQTVECLAQRKGEAVFALRPDCAVISADSMACIDGMVLGKPVDDEDAKAMLRRLSGRTHELYTGVCLLLGDRKEVFHSVTEVTFYPLTEEEIDEYVGLGESRGRAGSYGIEGLGVTLVESITGDYSNVVGLPVAEVLRRLRKMAAH